MSSFFAKIISPKINKAKLQLEKSSAKHEKAACKMLVKLTPDWLFRLKTDVKASRPGEPFRGPFWAEKAVRLLCQPWA
jgi:hypothetical protein